MAGTGRTSISGWIDGLKQGDELAAYQLWQRYFSQVVEVASRRLGNGPRRVADEEDVAASVFESLCRGAAAGRFSKLSDRHDLWLLLLTITRQKAVDQIRHRIRQKRGGGVVRGESAFVGVGDQGSQIGLEQMVAEAPSPEMLTTAQEQCERLLGMLRDDTLRKIAILRLEGYSNSEIAQQFDRTPRSIERKLRLIRDTWEAEFAKSCPD